MHPELKSGDRILILGNQEVWPKNLPPIFVEFNQCEMICSWHHGAVIVMVMTMSNIALMLMMFLLMIVRVVESARGLWRRRTLIRGLSLPHTCTRISTLARQHERIRRGGYRLNCGAISPSFDQRNRKESKYKIGTPCSKIIAWRSNTDCRGPVSTCALSSRHRQR